MYAALNPCDWQIADKAPEGAAEPVFPLVVGVDYAGRVDMIGSGENRFRVGDEVFGRVSGSPTTRARTATTCPSRRTPRSPWSRTVSRSGPLWRCRPPG